MLIQPWGTEGIDDVDPAVVQLLLVVVDHRDIDAVLVLFLITTLLEGLVFEVPLIIANLGVEVFGNGIKTLVDEHNANDRTKGIEATVQREAGEINVPCPFMKD